PTSEIFTLSLHDALPILKQAAIAELSAALDVNALEQARVHHLGVNGRFTGLMKQLGGLPKEQKPLAGKAINAAKAEIEDALAKRDRKSTRLNSSHSQISY